MGTARPRAVVLDAGAVIAFERGDARMRALVREALKNRARILIPAGVLGQVVPEDVHRRWPSAIRAWTSFRTKAAGSGLSAPKCRALLVWL
jgi:hypothetical protein